MLRGQVRSNRPAPGLRPPARQVYEFEACSNRFARRDAYFAYRGHGLQNQCTRSVSEAIVSALSYRTASRIFLLSPVSSKPPSSRSSPEKPRSLSATCGSERTSTSFNFRDMTRVRLPRLSTELLAALSWRASELTTSPYLSNSPFIAPSSCQTSLDLFCKASDRNPIWNDVSSAAKFVGPAMMTRKSRCSCSDKPGWRKISAYRLSVGTNRIANSRVCGGLMYLLLISFAQPLILASSSRLK